MSSRDDSRVCLSLVCAAVCCSLAGAGTPAEVGSVVPERPALSLERLACLGWCELEQIYRQATPGVIPEGYLRGRAIYCPEEPLTPARSKVSQGVWHGKFFRTCDGILVNRWCLGLQAVKARVCYGESWLDGGPAIVMDYRGESPVVWRDVRDEIREVAPGLYLGLMYKCKKGEPRMKMFFALEACPCGR